jgi:hypothetical protein
MDAHTCRTVFNPQLTLAKANDMVIYYTKPGLTHLEPLPMQHKIQSELRRIAPGLTVKFVDPASELEVAVPDGDYILTLVQEAPIYSGSVH